VAKIFLASRVVPPAFRDLSSAMHNAIEVDHKPLLSGRICLSSSLDCCYETHHSIDSADGVRGARLPILLKCGLGGLCDFTEPSAKRRGQTGEFLKRLFRDFPAGVPGLALLLFRLVLGAALGLQGVSLFSAQPASGVFAVLCGVFLIAGYLTPITCIAVLAGALVSGRLDLTKSALIFPVAIVAGLVGLGPGAYSADARLFGHREIIIPSRAADRRVE